MMGYAEIVDHREADAPVRRQTRPGGAAVQWMFHRKGGLDLIDLTLGIAGIHPRLNEHGPRARGRCRPYWDRTRRRHSSDPRGFSVPNLGYGG